MKPALAAAAWLCVAWCAYADGRAANFIGFLVCVAAALTLACLDRAPFDS